jgi:hypothetical protein
VIHLAVHRDEAQGDQAGALGQRGGEDFAGLRINRFFLFPCIAALVAGFDDFEFVILDVFPPRQPEALLIELLEQRDITLPRRPGS